jgi:hypothetical protein
LIGAFLRRAYEKLLESTIPCKLIYNAVNALKRFSVKAIKDRNEFHTKDRLDIGSEVSLTEDIRLQGGPLMDTKFATASIVNDLARDLLHFIERFPEDGNTTEMETLFRTGIQPAFKQAETSIANRLGIAIERKKPERSLSIAPTTKERLAK